MTMVDLDVVLVLVWQAYKMPELYVQQAPLKISRENMSWARCGRATAPAIISWWGPENGARDAVETLESQEYGMPAEGGCMW